MSSLDLRLCDLIIGQHFGEINQKVVHVLAAKGPLLSGQISQLTKLPAKQVRESLFVLVHHGLVMWSQTGSPVLGAPDMVTYHLLLDQIFLRLAYPIFIRLAHSQLGQQAAETVMEVAKLGRCPSDQLEKETLGKLLSEGFLEVCTLSMSKIENENDENASSSVVASPKKRAARESPTRTKKVRFEQAEETKKTFVRLATRKFINAVWYEQLVATARRQINDAAGEVMESALAMSSHSASTSRTLLNSFQIGHKLKTDTPLLVDSSTIGTFSSSTNSSKNPSSDYLEVMAASIPFFRKAGDQAGGQFYIDFPASVETLQMRDILSFIKARFGAPSARIFRILANKKFLEEKVISKIAMISGKETRERLFNLLQHGFLHMQEVPRTADHAPSRTIYLWTIPFERVRHQMVGRLRKTQVNLLQRIQHERNKYRMLITKTERSDVAANLGLLFPMERAQLQALTAVLERLEYQIIRVASEHLLFSEFK